MRTTITIARQFGCGGSVVGQMIAEKLGIRCIDREIVSQTARQFQMDENEVATREEKVSSFWERILSGMTVVAPEASYVSAPTPVLTDKDIFTSETEVMRQIAQNEDCVIVGRAAVHVLPPDPGAFNVFLHAPFHFRLARVMAHYHVTNGAEASAMIKRSDDMRAKFITQMTGKETTDARNYHLCVDSSSLPLEEIADMIIACARHKSAF